MDLDDREKTKGLALRPDAKQRAPAAKVLARQDEMAEWIAGFDRYRASGKGGADRGAYLRLYNGGRFTIDRIGRGSFAIPKRSACVLGGIQPKPIQRIAREAADDGLLQRFIYCVTDRQNYGEDRPPNRDALRCYQALFSALVALHPPTNSLAETSDLPRAAQSVVFHADAHRHRLAINDLARAMAAVPDTSNRLKSALGKWPGLLPRLALTFHLIEIADARARNVMTPVLTVFSEATAGGRRTTCATSCFHTYFGGDHVPTAQTGMPMDCGSIPAPPTATSSRHTGRSGLRSVDANVWEVIESLVTVGWLRPEEQSNPARPPAACTVNPAVLSVFAERGEQEREARTKARGQLAKVVARACLPGRKY